MRATPCLPRARPLTSVWRVPSRALPRISCGSSLLECTSVTDDGIARLVASAGAALRRLCLGGVFSPLTDEAAVQIANCCGARLRHVGLHLHQARIGARGFTALAPLAQHWTSLDLSRSSRLTPSDLAIVLCRRGPGCGAQLRVLVLRSCSDAVSDETLAAFLPRAHSLARLDVSCCTLLTDLTAMLIASARQRALQALRHVDISECSGITDRGREKLRRAVPIVVARMGLKDSIDAEGQPEPWAERFQRVVQVQ